MSDEPKEPKPRRRLPVLQANPPEPEEEERTPTSWMLLGGVAMLLVWTLLAGVVNAVLQRIVSGALWLVIACNLFVFGLSVAIGAFILGAFAKNLDAKRAQLVGSVTAVLGVTFGFTSAQMEFGLAWILSALIFVAFANGFARLGFVLGRKRLR